MTISEGMIAQAALERLLAGSDPRVRSDIERVMAAASSEDALARPGWIDDGAAALRKYRSARFGGARPGPLAEAAGSMAAVEAVARAVGRPVYLVRDSKVDLTSARAEAQAWGQILAEASLIIERAAASVGRIEVENYSALLSFAGTGWLIDEGIVVTNRHVAEHFAERQGAIFRFKIGRDRVQPVRTKIDFREEFERPGIEEMPIERIVWMPSISRPDVAFLGLSAGSPAPTRRAIPLARTRSPVNTMVGVMGYPARDYEFWDKELLRRLFGDIYDKKRFAPGNVLEVGDSDLDHDCTTLGGNSGSVVLDLGTGEAVGLHYAGIPLIENKAVPAGIVAEALRRARSQHYEVPPVRSSDDLVPAAAGAGDQASTVKVIIPIEVTVTVGRAVAAGHAVAAAPVRPPGSGQASQVSEAEPSTITRPSVAAVEAAVIKARALLGRRDDVVAIRPGYRFEDGYITPQRAVVISVANKQALATLADRGVQPLPKQIEGIIVDVTNATLSDVLAREGLAEAPAPRGHNYKVRTEAKFELKRIKEAMKATLHSGPDAGWPLLQAFLKRTRRRLTVGIFEYTAPHVVEAGLDAIGNRTESMLLVVQKGETIGEGTKADDIPDEETVRRFIESKGEKFKHAWASIRFKNGIQLVNPDGIFDSSYHIKVAVRDGKELWLSSGSWQSSNQPPFDPLGDGDRRPALINTYNREWHAIIEHVGLSALYEEHLKRDYEDALAAPMPEAVLAQPDLFVWVPASYFEPSPEAVRVSPRYFKPLELDRVIDVQPVLSPDNYLECTHDLIRGAQRSVFFQNQSLKIRQARPAGYEKLLRALLDKQEEGLDVRIIFRPFQDIRTDLEALQDYGFDMGKVRLDAKCHTKGIIVDSQAVLLGSHNWTNAGTSYNRDASLIFHDREIAEFYEQIFLYDWSRARRARIDESVPAPLIARPEEAVPPPGMVKVRLLDLEIE